MAANISTPVLFDASGYTIIAAGKDDVAAGLAQDVGEELAYGADSYYVQVQEDAERVTLTILEDDRSTPIVSLEASLAALQQPPWRGPWSVGPGWTASGKNPGWDLIAGPPEGERVEVHVDARTVRRIQEYLGIV